MGASADDALSLPARVKLWGVRWHQRVAIRKWPDATDGDAPFKVEVVSGHTAADGDDKPHVRLAMEMNLGRVDDQHAAWLRGAVKIDDDRLLGLVDAEVRVLFGEGDVPADEELIDFAQNWGHDYLMGYLRTGLADSGALVGLPNLILPPSPLTRPSRHDAMELLQEARRRAEANRDSGAGNGE